MSQALTPRRRGVFTKVAAAMTIVVLPLVASLAIARADAPDPKLPPFNSSSTTTVDPVTGDITVTLYGDWQWTTHHSDCNTDRFAAGIAIDWHDSTQPGNLVANGVKVGTPTDNNVYFFNNGAGNCGTYDPVAKFNSGSWGPITHVYPAGSTNITACPVTYDVHLAGGKGAPAAKAGDLVAGGNGHNHDNSVQSNGNTPLGNGCFAAAIPSLTTTASASVPAGGSVMDTAHLTGGVAPTGDMKFELFGPNDTNCTGGAINALDVATVAGNNDYDSQPVTVAAAGTYRWVVTYTSNTPANASATSPCNSTNESVLVTTPGNAHVTIVKSATPNPSAQVFSFAGTPVIGAFSLDVNTDPALPDHETFDIAPGNYSVTETVPSGWDLTALTCTSGSGIPSLGTQTVAITVAANENLSCTFTNVKQVAHVTIIKAANVSSAQVFSFAGTGGNAMPANFDLDVNGDPTLPSQRTFDVDPGSYSVTETVPGGWDLTGLTCSTGKGTPDLAKQTVAITVANGDNLSCTFTNTKRTSGGNPPTPHPAIGLVKGGPAQAKVGDTITYTFAATNTGDVPLTGVTLTDPKCNTAPTLVSKTGGNQDGTLDPGETWNYTCPHLVTPADPDPLPNTGTVTTAEGPTANASHTVDLVQPGQNLTKDGPASAHVGDTVHYTFVATNTGAVGLTGVTLNDPRCDSGPTLDSTTGNQDNVLDPGEVWSYSCDHVVTANDPDPMPNTATLTTVEGGSSQASHEVDIIHPAITITKVPDPQTGAPGTPVTFTYTVTNSGDVTLTNVSVDDDKLGHIGDVASLAPGQTVTLHASTVIGTGSVTNVAIAGGTDPLGTKVSANATATITPAAQVLGETQVRGEELARTGSPVTRWMAGGLLALSFGLLFLAASQLIASRVAYADVSTRRGRAGKHVAPESRLKRGLRFGASMVAAGWIYRSINRRK